MAQIADRDHIVEFRSHAHTSHFDVGGRQGNIVITSMNCSVHKGWRVVAVDGQHVPGAELGRALAKARHRGHYFVTFRVGGAEELVPNTKEVEADNDLQKRAEAEAQAEVARRAAEEA